LTQTTSIEEKKVVVTENNGLKMLEQQTIKDRTLLAYYDVNKGSIGLVLFHSTEQPNHMSKVVAKATWGFATYAVNRITSEAEAAEIVGYYLNDMENDNAWWEDDKREKKDREKEVSTPEKPE